MAASISAEVKLLGTDNFRTAIQNVKGNIKNLEKELTALSNEMKKSGTNYKNLGQKLELLQEKLKQEKLLLEAEKVKLDNSREAKKRNQQKVEELRKALDLLNAAEQKNADKIAAVTIQLQRAENKVQTSTNAINRYSANIKNTEQEIERLNTDIQQTETELKSASTAFAKAGTNMVEFGKKATKLGQQFTWVGQNFQQYISRPIQQGFQGAVESGMNFEKALSRVQATMMSDKTSEEMQAIKQSAQELGEQTVFTATQAADAFNYMALAGYDAETAIETLPKVLALAIAGDMDLAQASDMVTDGLTAFGLGTENASEFVDKMAKTASTTNTNVSQLGEALLTVGAAGAKAKGGITEVDTVLGLLASSGIKASEAGTALRNIFLILQSKADDVRDSFGVEVYDEISGEMRGLNEIFNDLAKSIDGVKSEEWDAKFSKIFGKRTYTAASTLLEQIPKMYDNIAAGINNASGAAQDMMDIMKDNFSGSVAELNSKIEALRNQIFELLIPTLNWLADVAKEIVDWFHNLDEGTQKTIVIMGGLAAALGPVVIALGSAMSVVGSLSYAFGNVIAVIPKAITLIASLGTTAQIALGAIGAAIAVGTALKIGLDSITKSIDDSVIAMNALSDETQKYIDSTGEVNKYLGEHRKALTEVNDEYQESIGIIENNVKTLEGNKAKLEELSEKGLKRTAEETENLKVMIFDLNAQFPDLNLAIDENTGKLNMNTEAIMENAEAYMYAAKAKGLKNVAEKAATEKATAEYQRTKAQSEISKLSDERKLLVGKKEGIGWTNVESQKSEEQKEWERQNREISNKITAQQQIIREADKTIKDSDDILKNITTEQSKIATEYENSQKQTETAIKKSNSNTMSYANAKDWVNNRAYLKDFQKYNTTEGDSYGRLIKRAYEEYSQSEDDDWYEDYIKEVKALSQDLEGKDSKVYATIKKYLAEETASGHLNESDYKNILDNMTVTQAKSENEKAENNKKATDEIKKNNKSVATEQKKETEKLNKDLQKQNKDLQKQYDKQIENSKKWIEYRNLYNDWDKYGTNEGESYGRIAEKMAAEYKANAVEYSSYVDKLNSLTASLTDKDKQTYDSYWQYIEGLYKQGLLAHEDYVQQREQLSALGYKAEQKAAEESLKEQKELYKKQQEDSKTWIGYRQLYGDWSEYDTTEGQSYGRVADKSGKAYEEGIIDYTEFTSEISSITKSLTEKNYDVYADFFDSLDGLYDKGLLKYDDYLRERNSLAALRYQAEQKIRENNAKQAEEIYKNEYKNVETNFDNQLKLLKSQIDEINNSYNSQISELKSQWDSEDRAKELHKLYEEADKYRRSVTITGQKKYEDVKEQIKKLEREEQIAQLQEQQARIVEQLEAEYKDLETKKADTLARMEENQEQYQNNVTTVLNAMNLQLADVVSNVAQAARLGQTITTNYITNDNSTNNNNATYNNNINDNVDMNIFSRMINVDKLMN